MLRVIVERSGDVVSDATFRKTLVSVGRDASNDVVLDDDQISSIHLLVKRDESTPDAFRVFDQSFNGTFWEEERIKTLRVQRPTVLRLGGFHLTLVPFEASGTAEAPAPIDHHAQTVQESIPAEENFRTAPYRRVEPQPAVQKAELRSISGTGELKALIFTGEALVGRSAECDLQFSSREISRRHCLIFSANGAYFVRRLSEKNNLEVNAREIGSGETMQLKNGDVIRLCEEEILFLHPATAGPVSSDVSMRLEAAPNVDLALSPRACADTTVTAFDVIGFLGAKTWTRFEQELQAQFRTSRRILLDLGYLIGLDGSGLSSLGRTIAEAQRVGIEMRLVRLTPRVMDIIRLSTLGPVLSRYISTTEDTAIKRLRIA